MKVTVYGYKPITEIIEVDDMFEIFEKDEELNELNVGNIISLTMDLKRAIREKLDPDFEIETIQTNNRVIYES